MTSFAPQAGQTSGQHAEQLFASGFFCAESSLLALAKAQGIESDLLPRIATAFCSGVSRSCGACGALTGAIMGVSLSLGRTSPADSVHATYRATQTLISKFESEFGSGNCQALLGCDLGTPEGQSKFREKQLGKKCAHYTRRATEIATEILHAPDR